MDREPYIVPLATGAVIANPGVTRAIPTAIPALCAMEAENVSAITAAEQVIRETIQIFEQRKTPGGLGADAEALVVLGHSRAKKNQRQDELPLNLSAARARYESLTVLPVLHAS